ncbi:response regulator [Phycisphaerales bacterium AB-hyl4]|uniref:Response regulator n=1 Tax=Natronomicrosphaera hydrolytica TaxID=3242702 RepID=A0ABV4TZW4_9BACT
MADDRSLILVVDDESHIVHVVSLKLQNAGYRVITAEDGEEALALALEQRPALVITDYQMPMLSGLELCQQLKRDPRTSDTPALMLTARGFSIGEDVLKQTNIALVLSKPFSPREVLARVKELLGKQTNAEAVQAP